jgi:hypothetical protein
MRRKSGAKLSENQLRLFDAPENEAAAAAQLELDFIKNGKPLSIASGSTGGAADAPQTDQCSDPSPFQRTPDQHRRVAARLRAAKRIQLALDVDTLAAMIERRLGWSTPSPPLAPQ